MKKHWLDGPRRYNENGELQVGDEPVVANPAFRFGVQRGEELRAVGYLKRSSTNGATFVPSPIWTWTDAALYKFATDTLPLSSYSLSPYTAARPTLSLSSYTCSSLQYGYGRLPLSSYFDTNLPPSVMD